ncbi:MAG: helix-turn-helix domain-containing protein [Magnetovibrionaceae bacterium]
MSVETGPGGGTRSTFSVKDIEEGQRFEVWRDSINCIFDVEADKEDREENFHADLDACLFGSLMLVETAASAQSWARNPSHIGRDGMDHFMVQVFKAGTMVHHQGKEDRVLDASQLVVFDLSRPVKSTTNNFGNLSLILPRAALEDALDFPDDQHMRFLDTGDGLTDLLRDTIVSLNKNLHNMPLAQADAVLESVAQLTSSCLNAKPGDGPVDFRQHPQAAMVTIKRFVRENLSRPDLNANLVASQLGMSRSKLYTLFDHYGGVGAYIRSQRLRRALLLLARPEGQFRGIYDIALECGYSSDASFIRAFKDYFGITPGDLKRTEAAARLVEYDRSEGHLDTRYETWLHHLS